MTSSLQFICQFERTLYVSSLRSFVAAAQQDHDHLATPDKLDAIAWPVVDPHFRDATAAGRDSRPRLAIAQTFEPSAKTSVSLTSINYALSLMEDNVSMD
jgi:hypothetical protein